MLLNTLVQTRQEHIDFGMLQVKLAEKGKAFSPPPSEAYYKYRILIPFFVKLLPFETKKGFKIVALLGCFITLFCLGLIFYTLRFDMYSSSVGIIIGAFTYTIIYSINYPYMPDSMNNAIITICFLGLIRRNFILVTLALVLGLSNHETSIAYVLLIPLFFTDDGKLISIKGLQYIICIGSIVIASKILVMLLFNGGGIQSRLIEGLSLDSIILNWKAKGGIIGALERVYITFHLLWFYAALGFRNSDSRVKKSWIMLFPMIFYFIFLADARRHLSYLLPIIITTGTYYFRIIKEKKLLDVIKDYVLLAIYIFTALLTSRDTQELFLRFQWPGIIENNIFLVTSFVNTIGIIIIFWYKKLSSSYKHFRLN